MQDNAPLLDGAYPPPPATSSVGRLRQMMEEQPLTVRLAVGGWWLADSV